MINDDNTFIYHKKTFFPSATQAIEFNEQDSSQLYFSSGNKLVLLNHLTNEKLFRINTRGKKILSFLNDSECPGMIYILDLDNYFYKFKIDSKEVISFYKLDPNKKYSTFKKDKNKFYFLNELNYELICLEISQTEEGEKINKVFEKQILVDNLDKEKQKNIFFELKNNYIITAFGRFLIIYNLTTNNINKIEYQKRLSCGIFGNKYNQNDYSIFLGDYAGKIHFISDITDQNVSITIEIFNKFLVCYLYKTLALTQSYLLINR
ncbi:MAG: hypothetical protein MJ252_10930 [archaeon]|nr:hypothetical protein [archaeon]